MRKSIYDEIPGDVVQTTGDDIGKALAPVVEKIGQENRELAAVLSKALRDAITENRPQIILPATETWARIVFDVVRDKAGNLTRIIATREAV